MMKKVYDVLRKSIIFGAIVIAAQANVLAEGNVELPLVPKPNSVLVDSEARPFVVNSDMWISVSSPELQPSAVALQKVMKARTGKEMEVKSANGAIALSIDNSLEGDEHYKLNIDEKGVTISGATPAAVFRGVMTLDQILLWDRKASAAVKLSAVKIDDNPRFGYRALMLDPARNFLPVDDVKMFIDEMARYKFNVLQLHLSDDQGWRVALEKHPELASAQSYSTDDLRDIISYAGERYIEVVPEFDMPGHTSAFLSVYPQLGCIHKQSEPIDPSNTVNRMVCASNPEVYNILGDVIDEVASIFPSKYIHLGGDEAAIPENWAKCDSCLELMKREGYEDVSQLMIPFFGQMLDAVRKNGKEAILWCELNNIYPPADAYLFPYPEDVTLVTWRAGLTPTCLDLTGKSGHSLIMAPGEYAYLDYPQLRGDLPEFNNWGMPVTTLRRSYEFDPGYGRESAGQAHVQGVMGTLWGEAIKDINRATYMAFPRALAIAEAGWTDMDNRSWENFKQRMYPNLADMMERGISFRVPFEVGRD